MKSVDAEFLPAALEIVETPASPVGRAIGGTIILFFGAALAWACFGTVDIVASAGGRVIPSGKTKIVQPAATGVVKAIHVRDGQKVSAGDVLIELDTTINAAEASRLHKDLVVTGLEAARLRAMAAGGELVPPLGALPAQTELQRSLLANQRAEYRARLAGLDRQIAQHEGNRAAVTAQVEKLSGAIPLIRQRAEAFKYLVDREYASRLRYLQLQQDLHEHEQELQVQKARLQEAGAGLGVLREQRRQAEAEFQRVTLVQLAQAEHRQASLEEELIKARQTHALQTLRAPVDGTVQQLSMHTLGGVVTPAQPLMVIVPQDQRLEVEALIANRDIGFIEEGQAVALKIDTFNFTRYGLLPGRVLSLSPDAVMPEKGAEPMYAARIALDAAEMQVDGRRVSLAPGMTVTAEIRTGERRVIEFLLSPLMRAKQSSLRER